MYKPPKKFDVFAPHVRHSGNTAAVGKTLVELYNFTADLLYQVMALEAIESEDVYSYTDANTTRMSVHVDIASWPLVYTHLKLLGFNTTFIPTYVLHSGAKAQEWAIAGFHEELHDAYKHLQDTCRGDTLQYELSFTEIRSKP